MRDTTKANPGGVQAHCGPQGDPAAHHAWGLARANLVTAMIFTTVNKYWLHEHISPKRGMRTRGRRHCNWEIMWTTLWTRKC